MAETWIALGLVVVKRPSASPWAEHEWLPAAALPEPLALPDWTRLRAGPEGESFYAGTAQAVLHPAETAHYRDNLQAAAPRVWVQLRPTTGPEGDARLEIVAASVDPYEGEAMADSIGDILLAFTLPTAAVAQVDAFFAAHHVERAFFKRERKRADPEALGRRVPVGRASAAQDPEE